MGSPTLLSLPDVVTTDSAPSKMNLRRPPFLTAPGWDRFFGLVHGFFGRRGGVSRPPFDSLNLSHAVGDEPTSVETNTERLRRALEIGHEQRIHLPIQVHGDRVLQVIGNVGAEGCEGDAVVTGEIHCFVGVLTADCVPILLAAPTVRGCGAVHAGWRGTAAAVSRRAVEQLVDSLALQPGEIHAAIGPAICGSCYEVGAEVAAAISSALGAEADTAIHRSLGRLHVDLRAANRTLLLEAGLAEEHIHLVGGCTACGGDFPAFSYRRDGAASGRQLSIIGWLPHSARRQAVR